MGKKRAGGVGHHIAAARKREGLTQEELADRLHVTRQTISNYESMRSQPDIQMLTQLADCLQVSVEELIYGQELPRSSRHVGGLAGFCRNLGIAVYLVGALWGLRAGSGVRKVGESGVAYAFLLGDAIPVWAMALIHGTMLIALGSLLYVLQRRERDGRDGAES